MKNHNLAFAIADASWCTFVAMLKYKAERKGSVVQLIDRFYASTQLCSACGDKTGPKGVSELNVRTWTCSNCGCTHGRDVNAANNILYRGIEEFFTVGTTG